MRLSSRHALIVSLSALGLVATAACSDDETQTDDDTTTTTTSGMGGDGGMTTTTSAMGGMTGTGGDVGGAGGVGGAGVGGAGGAGGMGGGGMGGAGGAGGGAMGSQAAYYWGDFDVNGDDEVALLAFPPGTAVKLVPMGITVIDDVFDVAPSPDGTQVAIALEADGNPAQILVMNADGTGVPVVAADLAGAPNATAVEISDLAWSPDGASIAFTADYSLNSHNTVYVVPADGTGTTPQLVSQVTGDADQDAYNVVWVDSTHVAYQADLVVAEVDNLYVSDVTLTTPAPVPLVAENLVSEGAEVESGAEVDASGKVYFRSTHEGGFYLYRADANGANLEQLPSAAALMKNGVQAEVGSFAISPDGTQIAFTADAPTADLYQIYVAPVNAASATLQSNVTTAAPAAGDLLGTDTFNEHVLSWSPDGMWLATAADWPVIVGDVDNDYAAFIVPATGAPGGVRIATVPSPAGNYDVNGVLFSADGARLFILADLVVNNNTELYSTTDFATADQNPTTIRVEEVPTSGDIVGIDILP